MSQGHFALVIDMIVFVARLLVTVLYKGTIVTFMCMYITHCS